MRLYEAHGGTGWRIPPQYVYERVPAHKYPGVDQQ